MSIVNISNVAILNNPAPFTTPLAFEITFECLSPLREDLEFKVTYVGSAESEQYDQLLESVMVGPVPVGVNKFVLECQPPAHAQIPASDLLGVTVLLLTCSYRSTEFIRVGYYVNNEYSDEEMKENPPATPKVDMVVRNILAEKPKVTRMSIEWDPKEDTATSSQSMDSGLGVGLNAGMGTASLMQE